LLRRRFDKSCVVVRDSQIDELCGLRQAAVSWAIFIFLVVVARRSVWISHSKFSFQISGRRRAILRFFVFLLSLSRQMLGWCLRLGRNLIVSLRCLSLHLCTYRSTFCRA